VAPEPVSGGVYQACRTALRPDNRCPGDVPGYTAGPGWDACTGWGSVNGHELLRKLRRFEHHH
jgi:hypothetical protein